MKPKLVEPKAALQACRILVEAYANDPEDVDWYDIQLALEQALDALGLPRGWPEQEYERRNP